MSASRRVTASSAESSTAEGEAQARLIDCSNLTALHRIQVRRTAAIAFVFGAPDKTTLRANKTPRLGLINLLTEASLSSFN